MQGINTSELINVCKNTGVDCVFVTSLDDVRGAAVAAVKGDLLNCVNWVSCFSNDIHSH